MRLKVLAIATLGVAVTSTTAINGQTPPAPTLTANVAASLVSLAWTVPAGSAPTRFEIHAGSEPGLSNVAVVAVSTTTSTFNASAPAGTYYVRVLAFSASGASSASNEVTVVVAGSGGSGCNVPGPPTNLVVIPASTTVTLRWNAPLTGGAPTGYSLLVGSTSGAVNVGTIAVGLTTTVTAPSPIGTYFVRVVAANDCGNSAPSEEVFFVAPLPQGVSVPVGTYLGTVFNYSPPGGALTSFTLQLHQPLPTAASEDITVSATWMDNRGCVKTTGFIGEEHSGRAYITLHSFTCNGELIFALRFRAVNGSVYTGDCGMANSGCTFQMIKQ